MSGFIESSEGSVRLLRARIIPAFTGSTPEDADGQGAGLWGCKTGLSTYPYYFGGLLIISVVKLS